MVKCKLLLSYVNNSVWFIDFWETLRNMILVQSLALLKIALK